jgi:hypothetical protein
MYCDSRAASALTVDGWRCPAAVFSLVGTPRGANESAAGNVANRNRRGSFFLPLVSSTPDIEGHRIGGRSEREVYRGCPRITGGHFLGTAPTASTHTRLESYLTFRTGHRLEKTMFQGGFRAVTLRLTLTSMVCPRPLPARMPRPCDADLRRGVRVCAGGVGKRYATKVDKSDTDQ